MKAVCSDKYWFYVLATRAAIPRLCGGNVIRVCLMLSIALLLKFVPAWAQDDEYVVKAAFIERVTRFIDWPDTCHLEDTSRPFVIGVLGHNPFGPILTAYFSKQTIKDKKVEIVTFATGDEIGFCHVLYIGKDQKDKLNELLKMIKHKPILTIADTENYAEAGVLINFYLIKNKVRYEVKQSAWQESLLKASSHLLANARIVDKKD